MLKESRHLESEVSLATHANEISGVFPLVQFSGKRPLKRLDNRSHRGRNRTKRDVLHAALDIGRLVNRFEVVTSHVQRLLRRGTIFSRLA